uniref:Uncharacterized protein n=1 Tax=viral metagenome TaxID=1070528 RepID=A0A6C0IZD8_9ZZZZ
MEVIRSQVSQDRYGFKRRIVRHRASYFLLLIFGGADVGLWPE